MSYLGIQDATRKRRPITQTPGEWTGSIVLSVEGVGVFVTISQQKWDRTRAILIKWKDKVHLTEELEKLPLLDYATLESDIGFLIHIAMAYPSMKPFLRGFYLTLNSWRSGRDKNGWKLSDKAYKHYLELGRQTIESEEHLDDIASLEDDKNAPKLVRTQPLLREHVTILMDMFSPLTPALRLGYY